MFLFSVYSGVIAVKDLIYAHKTAFMTRLLPLPTFPKCLAPNNSFVCKQQADILEVRQKMLLKVNLKTNQQQG